MYRSFLIYFLFVPVFISGSIIFPQENNFLNKLTQEKNQNTALLLFNQIETGISTGSVSLISAYFSSQTYLSLSSGTSGYYSSNQAYYVLEDFFKIYKVTSFRFDNISSEDNNPYGTGIYNFEFKGMRSSAQVYVSLKRTGKGWKIIQITIN